MRSAIGSISFLISSGGIDFHACLIYTSNCDKFDGAGFLSCVNIDSLLKRTLLHCLMRACGPGTIEVAIVAQERFSTRNAGMQTNNLLDISSNGGLGNLLVSMRNEQ